MNNWPIPEFTKSQVSKAGETLINPTSPLQQVMAFRILNNWRSCHGYPINTFQSTLRKKLVAIGVPKAIVAQRLKRTPSIIRKLKRFKHMQLSRMQDIGGLRAVVRNLEQLRALESNYAKSRFEHFFVSKDDYILSPKKSGYRGVHIIYKYRNKKVPVYDGLLLELQIRTDLQHAWATAVETIDTFLEFSLKASEGPRRWLKFFALVGSAFAHLEETTPVPEYGHLSKRETFLEVVQAAKGLGVRHKLSAFSIVANHILTDEKTSSYHYHLIELNPAEKTVSLRSFGRDQVELANEEYSKKEQRILKGEKLQIVLVSAGNIETLKRAYPNYFLDTKNFVQRLDEIETLVGKL
ncbi:MAG: RelA/SpoT domain-containing protein [Candidatus Omnitrophota bacterium]|nr:RelA/SpoT domain-containing protein [Candidatus Omnitrophota bacterium]